jgi:formamidase
MNRTIGVVAAQVAPVPYDREATFRSFEGHVRTLAAVFPNLELYVFPEVYLAALGSWNDGYPAGYVESVAEPIGGTLTQRVAELARSVRKWIVPGSVYEQADGTIYNTALVFSPDGELVATYRKLMPWMPYESTSPGKELVVFDIPDVGRFGLTICFDAWVPEITRNLAWMGAEVILQPTYTRTNDRELELVLTRANAIANQVYVVSPNYGGLMGTGRSLLVGPEGHTLALGGSGEEYLNQVLDIGRVDTVRQHGTFGMIRMWQQLRDVPPPPFPAYEQGFAAGPIMRGLGPLSVSPSPSTGAARPIDEE